MTFGTDLRLILLPNIILSAGWLRDTADDRLYPTRGSLARLRLEWSPPGKLSDYPYASLEATGAAYRNLGHGWVGAGRLGLGLAGPVGEAVDLLPNKRFYAGGGTSMRGFKRHRLGPMDADGAPFGGEAKLEAGVELRFPLAGRLAAAWFVDAGQVWRDRRDVNPGELEVATGPGLMVQTPVGYIRADLGRRLTTRQPDEPRTVFHLSIGHPY